MTDIRLASFARVISNSIVSCTLLRTLVASEMNVLSKPVQCGHCPDEYETKGQYQYHFRTVHKEEALVPYSLSGGII